MSEKTKDDLITILTVLLALAGMVVEVWKMILIKDGGGWYKSAYYRNQTAKEKNQKSYFKNISSIYVNDYCNITIYGTMGTQTFIYGYTIKQAIKKYNQNVIQYKQLLKKHYAGEV